EQGMLERLQDLDESTKGLLDMIYVDVFFDTRWPAHKMAEGVNDKLGMALGTEYVDEFTKDSVWAHHINNRFNDAGNIVRVIDNNDKDICGIKLCLEMHRQEMLELMDGKTPLTITNQFENSLHEYYRINILLNIQS